MQLLSISKVETQFSTILLDTHCTVACQSMRLPVPHAQHLTRQSHVVVLSLTLALLAWLVAIVEDIGVEECFEAEAVAAVAARWCRALQIILDSLKWSISENQLMPNIRMCLHITAAMWVHIHVSV